MLISKTPFRVSLFGGGSDYPEHFLENNGAVLVGSINKYCIVALRKIDNNFGSSIRLRYSISENVDSVNKIKHPVIRKVLEVYGFQEPIELNHFTDFPSKSGIGSSSAFVVSMLALYEKQKSGSITNIDLAKKAIDFEHNKLKENIGVQDSIATAIGGLNYIEFNSTIQKFNIVSTIDHSQHLSELTKSLFLVHTNISRVASKVAEKQINEIHKHASELNELSEIAKYVAIKLKNQSLDLDELGQLLAYSWEIKKRQSPLVSNSKIDSLYNTALANGATGGKLLGAGSGGFFLFCVPPKQEKQFTNAIRPLLVSKFDWTFDGNKFLNLEKF